MAIPGIKQLTHWRQYDAADAPVTLYLILCLASTLAVPAAQWIAANTPFPVPRAIFAGLFAGHFSVAVAAVRARCFSLLAVTISLLGMDIYAIAMRL